MTAQSFVDEATKYLGFRARPGGLTEFAQRAGYAGHDLPWDGAFVDCVAYDSGLQIPSCVYTPAAMAEFSHSFRWKKHPRPGDIVFFAFPTLSTFGAPHVGIVTNTDKWRTDGTFLAVEGNIDAGLPRSSKEKDGVYERLRWKNEVIGFCRPDFKSRLVVAENAQTGPKTIKIAHIRPEKRHESVLLVQKALKSEVFLTKHAASVFDLPTRKAYAEWQRKIGRAGADADGIPTPACLKILGLRTGIFSIDSEN